MKGRKKAWCILAAVFAAALCVFTACGKGNEGGKPTGTETNAQSVYATALKDTGDTIAQTLSSTPATYSAEVPPSEALVYGSWVATLTYYVGLLYEDEKFSATEVPATISGQYDTYVDGKIEGSTLSVAWKIYTKFDIEQDKMLVLVEQDFGWDEATDMAFDIRYDFDAKNLIECAMSFGEGGMLRYTDDKYLLPEETDADYAATVAHFDTLFADFSTKKPQSKEAPAGSNVKYCDAYEHCMALMGQSVDMRLHEAS